MTSEHNKGGEVDKPSPQMGEMVKGADASTSLNLAPDTKIYLLNTLVVPVNFDKHPTAKIKLTKITVDEAREMLINNKFISAVGHEGTAKLLSQLLGIAIQINRITAFFEPGDVGIHFFLKTRLPEGKILSAEELAKLDYWLVKSEVE